MKKIISSLIIILMITILAFDTALGEGKDYFQKNKDIVQRDWTILNTYTIPGKASGLAYDGSYLYSGIYGSNGDKVYKIDPYDGSYELLFSDPTLGDSYGMTYDGSYLRIIDHDFGNPALLKKYSLAGVFQSQIILSDDYMSGVAYDNDDSFWVGTYYPDPGYISKIDTLGNVLRQISPPASQTWDIALEADSLWVVDYYSNNIYKLDKNGTIVETHPAENIKPSGVVYDGTYLWYCDGPTGSNSTLYQVDLGGAGTPEINIPITYHNYGNVTVGDSSVWNCSIYNNGTADLIIEDITFSGSNPPIYCDYITPDTIASGNSVLVPFVYAPNEYGELNTIATVESNDPVTPDVDITLTGNAVLSGPAICVPDSAYDFGLVRLNSLNRWFMEIQNIGNEVLTIDTIYTDNPSFYIDSNENFPILIGVLDTIWIGVWFHPEQPISYNAILYIESNSTNDNIFEVQLQGESQTAEYPMGTTLWNYYIDVGWDNSPKAISSIPDINGDGIDDVIICSEDNFIRCFNGNSCGTADILWEYEIYAGDVYSYRGLQIIRDIDGDGHKDVIVGTVGGDRSIRAISGLTGQGIWVHDTHEYGDGGWVYQVNCRYDYNDDDILDVLAATGDDSYDTGPQRVYCLDGTDGNSIWEFYLPGPKFSVIGIKDVNGDLIPDALCGASDASEINGYAYCINGSNGSELWNYPVSGSSVWALEQLDDITGDGIKDVIVGDFAMSGNSPFYALDATDGSLIFSGFSGGSIVTQFVILDDVNSDGYSDVAVGHSSNTFALVVDGYDGNNIWAQTLADQPWVVDKIDDINNDGINDVVWGTLFNNNYCYFLSGTDGAILHSINLGTAVDAIASIPDIVGDNSMEMVAGGRSGAVYCFSGGTELVGVNDYNYDKLSPLKQNYPNPFRNYTTISFNNNRKIKDLKLNIYNIKGQLVRSIECNNYKNSDSFYSIIWDRKDNNNKPVSSGIYFYQIKSKNSKSEIKKMIIVQ